jgi:surfactin synthase thioesterase subunit
VLAAPDLMALLLPVLRADFRANEESIEDGEVRLNCPFTLIAANDDSETGIDKVWAWEKYTTGKVRRVQLHGDHFSILREPGSVLDEIRSDLREANHAPHQTAA